jgi:hypothetical protein
VREFTAIPAEKVRNPGGVTEPWVTAGIAGEFNTEIQAFEELMYNQG